MKRLIWSLVALILIISIAVIGCGQQAPAPATGPVKDFQMIGATVGSGTHAINVATAEMWNKYVTKPSRVNVSVRPYQAVIETFKSLDGGSADITWAPAAFEFFISKGIAAYTDYGKRSFYKLLAGGEGSPFVLTTDPNIKKIADLKGKKVAGKKPADAPLDHVRQAYLQANGLTDNDIKLIEFASYPESIRMLKEGTADAIIFLSSTLNPSVEELAASKAVYFIPVTDTEIEAVFKVEPFRYKTIIPAGTYKGQNFDVPIASEMEGVFVRHDFDQELAYEMVKALYENYNEFAAYHATIKYWTLNHAASVARIYHPFAPGSVKYFKEKGIWTDQHEAKQQELLKAAGL